MIAVVSGQYLMAAVFVGVSLLMRDDNFSRNRAIGIRTKHTLSSDEAWRRGHRAGWPWVLSAGIAAAVTGTAGLSISLATRGVSAWMHRLDLCRGVIVDGLRVFAVSYT